MCVLMPRGTERGQTMRRAVMLVLLVVLALPAMAVKRINSQQLDEALAGVRGKPDKDVARWLTGLELTNRVSTSRFKRWSAVMPGTESRRALAGLVDASVFLNLPAGEISSAKGLDHEAQKQLLAQTSGYVEKTLSKLPNFFAAQVITLFEDTPPMRDGASFTAYAPLHFEDLIRANVLYRGGKEVMETRRGEVAEGDATVSPTAGLLS